MEWTPSLADVRRVPWLVMAAEESATPVERDNVRVLRERQSRGPAVALTGFAAMTSEGTMAKRYFFNWYLVISEVSD